MTTYLLDVNLLVALLSPRHDHHLTARTWFEREGHQSWLTCPITQNGAIRVLAGPAFSRTPITVAQSSELVEGLLGFGNHQFVPDAVSILNRDLIIRSQGLTPSQTTDTYLLALAVYFDAELATFDRRIAVGSVRGGEEHLLTLP